MSYGQHNSWSPVDLEEIRALGDLAEAPPEFARRTDGHALLYRGMVNGIHGEPESCKGWFACAAVAELLYWDPEAEVVYIDFEDSAKGLVRRMLSLGLGWEHLVGRFHYLQPDTPLDRASEEILDLLMQDRAPSLVVFDGVTQAVSNQGLDSNSNDAIGQFFRELPRRIARIWGPAVLLIDHVTKSTESRGRYGIGAQQKLAAIDGAQYSARLVHPFAPGKHGHIAIDVVKDRPGEVRRWAVGPRHSQRIAEFHLASDLATGRVTFRLDPPEAPLVGEDGVVVPTVIMERLSEMLEGVGESVSRESVIAAVTGKTELKRRALDLLVLGGFIEEERDGRIRTYRSIRPYVSTAESGDNLTAPPPPPANLGTE